MKTKLSIIFLLISTISFSQKLNVPKLLVKNLTVVVAHDTTVSHQRIIDTVWNHYQNGDFIDYSEKKTIIDTVPYNLLQIRTTTLFEYDDTFDSTTISKYVPKTK